MPAKKVSGSLSKIILIIVAGVVVILAGLYYYWQKNKYGIVKNKLSDTIMAKTDSLYNIKYDSLYFDEISGEAFLKNVRVIPDTNRVRTKPLTERPYSMLEVKVSSIVVKGVKTDKALIGQQIVGDSVIIDQPEITVYFLKSLKKETKIDVEAKELYKQILGNLDLIKVGNVFIRNATVKGITLRSHQKEFDLANTNITLKDVRIDSAHNEDTTRTLFCKEASFQISQFTSFNNERPLLSVSDIKFEGKKQTLSFSKFILNRFEDDFSSGISLLEVEDMSMTGINSNEIVKNKNLLVDNLSCKHIVLYRPPAVAVKPKPQIVKENVSDTGGFMRAYSIDLNVLDFPNIDVLENPAQPTHNNFEIGKFYVKIKGVQADELLEMQTHPIAHIHEADMNCNSIAYKTPDHLYRYDLKDIHLNTLVKKISVGSLKLTPSLSEEAFTKQARVQTDRYDISLKDLSLEGVDFDNLLEKKLTANALNASNNNIKIYRDISYPLSGESKVGHYPHESLIKSQAPINIRHAAFNNTYLEYKEKNALSDKSGMVKFEQCAITLDNITNMPALIKQNNIMAASFRSSVLGKIPLTANFKFFLSATDGKFAVNGNIGNCDAEALNIISVPMALIRINQGKIEGADFNFTGNDYQAGGDFVMRYSDFKIALLKKNDDLTTKKRGFLSALANTLVRNENPHNNRLRTYTVDFKRDPQKSFFNLIWKTIFSGMQGTMGIPTNNAKEK